MPLANVNKLIAQAVTADFPKQVAFLSTLVKAPSPNTYNPQNSPANMAVEGKVAKLIFERLEEIGLKPQYKGVNQIRQNVIAEWGEQRARKSILLNGHMDTTAPVDVTMKNPYSGRVRNGKMYGVGVLDMKASLSAYVYAVNALIKSGVKISGGKVMLGFVVDEESGASSKFGSYHLLEASVLPRACFIGEHGSQYVRIGQRGAYRFKLSVYGESAHTGMSAWERGEKGHNAAVDMAKAIEVLQGLEIPYKASRTFPNRKPVFTFPTMMEGGSAINAVPSIAVAYGDVRLLPGNSDSQVSLLIVERLIKLGIKYKLEDLLYVPSVEIDPHEEIVIALQKAAHEVWGVTPEPRGAGPGTDAWMYIRRDIPTICGFGPDGEGAHGGNEWVDLESLKKVTEVYARMILNYLT